MVRAIRRLLQRFSVAQAGSALVEFALIVPIMLTLYAGSVELSQLITADRRVQVVTGTLGDLVSRSNKTICATQITDIFKAARLIMAPFDTGPLNQVVTQISVDTSGNAKVLWSRAYGTGAVAYTKDATYNLPKTSEVSRLARGGTLIVADAAYSYTPTIDLVLNSTMTLNSQNFYTPRFEVAITLNTSC